MIAPTSIAVFVGYTHPYKTLEFGIPVQLFSFADYERHFGGLYTSGVFDHTVAHSVNQFFLNGGTNAYVVGLKSEAVGLEADSAQSVKAPFATFDDNGAGKAIVAACVERARERRLRRVFALTLVPAFFTKCGFTLTSLGRLPEKSAAECPVCPKRFACDEHAMLLHLDGSTPVALAPGEPVGYTRLFLHTEPS